MKPVYVIIPKDHKSQGKRRKVMCKCNTGFNGADYEEAKNKTIQFFVSGRFQHKCKVCNEYHFYVE